MKRKKQQQQQHCSSGNANGLQSNGIPPQHQLQQQQKVYVSLYPQMMGATEPNYETLSRQQVIVLQGSTKRLFPGCVKLGEKSCVLFIFCRQEHTNFSTLIHTTWEEPFCPAL